MRGGRSGKRFVQTDYILQTSWRDTTKSSWIMCTNSLFTSVLVTLAVRTAARLRTNLKYPSIVHTQAPYYLLPTPPKRNTLERRKPNIATTSTLQWAARCCIVATSERRRIQSRADTRFFALREASIRRSQRYNTSPDHFPHTSSSAFSFVYIRRCPTFSLFNFLYVMNVVYTAQRLN